MTKVEQDHSRASRFGRMLRGGLVGAGIAALLAGFGCGMKLPVIAQDEPRSGDAGKLVEQRRAAFVIDHDAYAGLGYRLDWRGFPVVREGQHITHFDAYDDVIVAQESGATVSVLEAANGEMRNSNQVASPLTRFLGNFRDGDRLVVSSDTEASTIDLQTGEIVARVTLDRIVSTAPVLCAGQKIYGTSIGHVYSHYVSPPVNAWAFDMGTPIDAELVMAGQTVVAVSRAGKIAMLDGPSGTLLGQGSIYGGCEADPVAGEGMVFFASTDQSIYGYTLTGSRVWRVRTEQPLRITPTYHAGLLYVPSADQGLRALDALTGQQAWNQRAVKGRVVAVRGGRLVTWDGAEAVVVDPATGDVVFSTPLPEVRMLKPDRLVDGNLYAVSEGGIVAKFKPRN